MENQSGTNGVEGVRPPHRPDQKETAASDGALCRQRNNYQRPETSNAFTPDTDRTSQPSQTFKTEVVTWRHSAKPISDPSPTHGIVPAGRAIGDRLYLLVAATPYQEAHVLHHHDARAVCGQGALQTVGIGIWFGEQAARLQRT